MWALRESKEVWRASQFFCLNGWINGFTKTQDAGRSLTVREHTRLYFGGVMLEMRSRDIGQGLDTGLEWGALGWRCDRSRQHPSREFKAWNRLGPELEARGVQGR